ncbi:DUF2203 family protein [Yinghuangia aomiensis]
MVRGQAAELAADLADAGGPTHGGLPELKRMHARLDELMTDVQSGAGAELKGFAPLLVDFPSEDRRRRGAALLARGRPPNSPGTTARTWASRRDAARSA